MYNIASSPFLLKFFILEPMRAQTLCLLSAIGQVRTHVWVEVEGLGEGKGEGAGEVEENRRERFCLL